MAKYILSKPEGYAYNQFKENTVFIHNKLAFVTFKSTKMFL